jgi:predicted acylesterase/phospholipase RssA
MTTDIDTVVMDVENEYDKDIEREWMRADLLGHQKNMQQNPEYKKLYEETFHSGEIKATAPPLKHTIKHLVIGSGGHTGMIFYGVLREAHQRGFWERENIQTIYGTSIGAVVGAMICMNHSWETLDAYLIHRPWDKVFPMNLFQIFDAMKTRGLFCQTQFEEIIVPLLKSMDKTPDITMEEFYEWTGVEFHVFITELNQSEGVDISYKTHPKWRLLDGLYASCALPVLFCPMLIPTENADILDCYIDGGIFNNYPILPLLSTGINPKEVFGIEKLQSPIAAVNESSNLVEFIMSFFGRMEEIIMYSKKQYQILEGNDLKLKNQALQTFHIEFEDTAVSIETVTKLTSSADFRENLIDKGVKIFQIFFDSLDIK